MEPPDKIFFLSELQELFFSWHSYSSELVFLTFVEEIHKKTQYNIVIYIYSIQRTPLFRTTYIYLFIYFTKLSLRSSNGNIGVWTYDPP